MHVAARRLVSRWGVVVAATLAPMVFAQSAESHDHHHGEAQPAPARPAGTRWQTDAPLRAGMESIKKQLEAALPRAHHGKLSAQEYAALGKAVDADIQKIFAQCKLPPDADAALHAVLVKIIDGSATVKSDGKRVQGLLKMMNAVNEYGESFDHPGWTPIKH